MKNTIRFIRISGIVFFGILSLVSLLVMTAGLTCIYTDTELGKYLGSNFPWLTSDWVILLAVFLSVGFGSIAGNFLDKVLNN